MSQIEALHGRLEAAELRDGGDRWSAMGVSGAVNTS